MRINAMKIVRVDYFNYNNEIRKVHLSNFKDPTPLKSKTNTSSLKPIVVIHYDDGLTITLVNTLTRAINWDGVFIPSQRTKVNMEDPMTYYAIESSNSVVVIKDHNYDGEYNIISPSVKYIKGGVIYASKMYFI